MAGNTEMLERGLEKAKNAPPKPVKKKKVKEFVGGGIQPEGTVYKPNPKGPQN